MHSGGSYCMVEALSAYKICEAHVFMAEAYGVRGFSPSVYKHSTVVPPHCLSCRYVAEHHTTFCRLIKQSFILPFT